MRLAGQAAVITGGGRGIGRAIALAFAQEGAHLVLASDVEAEVQAVAAEARGFGQKALALKADVTRSDEMEAMARRAVAELGHLDILVTCAGIDGTGLLLEQDEAEWRRVIDVNLFGTYRAMRAVLPQMMRQKAGRIIAIASVFGKQAGQGFVTAYITSKHGVIGLTRAVAAELGSLGYPEITVNAVCPGYVRAGMWMRPQPTPSGEMLGPEIFERYLKNRVPQRRMMEAEEVANVAVFLALPETRGMTGQALNIDGGLHMS
ncbi:MAG: SDR family oxidoreductase [Candidatus Rokubacteria bacterium]|nr:SDR family oxidoreductase [Candidatus Rokubacteria bacterium]